MKKQKSRELSEEEGMLTAFESVISDVLSTGARSENIESSTIYITGFDDKEEQLTVCMMTKRTFSRTVRIKKRNPPQSED